MYRNAGAVERRAYYLDCRLIINSSTYLLPSQGATSEETVAPGKHAGPPPVHHLPVVGMGITAALRLSLGCSI